MTNLPQLSPRFHGLWATQQAQKSILNGNELKQLLTQETASFGKNPYIGAQLPPEFLNNDPAQALKTLDQLASALKRFDTGLYKMAGFSEPFSLPVLSLQLGEVPVQLKDVGSGNFGRVFKVTVNQRNYALKVFFPRHREIYFSGPYNEAALGVYLTRQNVSNMPRFWMANPEAGWMLSDFVDAAYEPPASGKGPTWESLGFQALDQGVPENEMQGTGAQAIRVDYGHLQHPKRKPDLIPKPIADLFIEKHRGTFVPVESFLTLLETSPESRPMILERLKQVEPARRLEVIEKSLSYPEFRHFTIQEFLNYGLLSKDQAAACFDLLIQHPDPEVRAMAIFRPEENPTLLKRFQKAWEQGPEFLPFLIYQGKRALLKQYFAQYPELKLQVKS